MKKHLISAILIGSLVFFGYQLIKTSYIARDVVGQIENRIIELKQAVR